MRRDSEDNLVDYVIIKSNFDYNFYFMLKNTSNYFLKSRKKKIHRGVRAKKSH